VIAAPDRVAIEAAVVQRDAPVRANVAQRKDPSVTTAPDEDRVAEQRFVHEPARSHVMADERDIPQAAQKLGLEILHGLVPGSPPVVTLA